MANNRLYIVDQANGQEFLLAKSMGRGWYLWGGFDPGKLEDFLLARDGGASLGFPLNQEKTSLKLLAESEPEYLEICKKRHGLTDSPNGDGKSG